MTTVFVGRENNDVKFTMEFTAEEFEAAIQKAYLKNRGRIAIDGFRKGKAPRKLIEAKYGPGVFFDEAIDSMLQENYAKALDELDIDPIDRPTIDFDGDEKIEQGKGFKMVVVAPVAPQVTVKDYKGIKAERELRKFNPEIIDEHLKTYQKRQARLIESEEAANWDDTVVLDYKGFVGDEQFEGGTAEDQNLILGSNTFIPGFEAQLVGCKKGDEKDVVVTFPEEYHAENLAGKEAVFKCTIKAVKTEELPAIDDELAKDVSEFDTLADLRADIEKKEKEQLDKLNENAGKEAVLQELCKLNPVDVPDAMVRDEADSMFNQYVQQFQMQGIDIDMYCKYAGTTIEEMRKGFEEDARKRVHSRLLTEAVADAENLTATDEDLEEELKSMAEQYGMEVERIKENFGEASMKMIKKDIRIRKALDLMCENAKFTEPKKKAEKKEDEKPAEEKAKKTSEKKPAEKKATEKKAPAKKKEEKAEE